MWIPFLKVDTQGAPREMVNKRRLGALVRERPTASPHNAGLTFFLQLTQEDVQPLNVLIYGLDT